MRRRRDGYTTPPDNLTRGGGYLAPKTPFEMPVLTDGPPQSVPPAIEPTAPSGHSTANRQRCCVSCCTCECHR